MGKEQVLLEVNRTYTKISPYNEDNRDENLEKSLGYYDKDAWKYRYDGLYYNKEKEELRIPRSVSISKLETLFSTKATVYKDCDEYDRALIRLNYLPRDDKQREAIAFLLSKKDHSNIEKYPRRMLELDTGVGKTYCTIAAISYMGVKGAILLNSKRLINQWEEKIQEYTNLNSLELFKVVGADSIKKILNEKTKKVKIYLVSHETLSAYAKREGWEAVGELFTKMRVGVKVYDEAHLSFKSMMKIDLMTNIKDTFYLTATAKRSDHLENNLYKKIFGPVPILSIKRKKNETYLKSMVLNYNSQPSLKDIGLVKNTHGTSMPKYMEYCYYGGGHAMYMKCITTILNTLESKSGKIAILVGIKKLAKDLKDELEKLYPDLKGEIGIFTSDIETKKKDLQLKKRLIISTFKSFGTGIDLNGQLRAVIMTEAYSSSVILHQCAGRLRQLDDGEVYYFELVDSGFAPRVKQFKKIKNDLLKISDKVTAFQIR